MHDTYTREILIILIYIFNSQIAEMYIQIMCHLYRVYSLIKYYPEDKENNFASILFLFFDVLERF